MSTAITPENIDYIDAAHKRVVADGLFLEKRADVTLLAGASAYALPAEVVALRGIFQGSTRLLRASPGDLIRYRSGAPAETSGVAIVYTVVGRNLELWPTLGQSLALTLIYDYRAPTIDSDSTLAVSGEAERLVERLAGAYELIDDGQPELGQAELTAYYTDLERLRRRHNAGSGRRRRVHVRGMEKSNAGRYANDVDVR